MSVRTRVNAWEKAAQAGERIGCAPALHFDGDDITPRADNEVHLTAALAPVEQIARTAGGRMGKVCADGGFDQPSEVLAVVALPASWSRPSILVYDSTWLE
jgi:hypothetical protein